MLVKKYFSDFLHLFFPRLCMACDTNLMHHEEVLCMPCQFHLPFTDFHLDEDNETAMQLRGKIQFEKAYSMLHLAKSSRVEVLLHRLKYKNQPEIGVYLGNLHAQRIKEIASDVDLIVPIPIHTAKLRTRGYNQAAEFAKGLSQGLDIPIMENILMRKVFSVSQTQKSRTDRYDNVKDVFAIASSYDLQDKHILLVDDVLTTGATICEAGNLLINKGAKVSVGTIARA